MLLLTVSDESEASDIEAAPGRKDVSSKFIKKDEVCVHKSPPELWQPDCVTAAGCGLSTVAGIGQKGGKVWRGTGTPAPWTQGMSLGVHFWR